MLIFGYGSLIAPNGINGRNLSIFYEDRDLTVCELNGFKRVWNATWNELRFLGLIEDNHSHLNGVTFELNDEDLDLFLSSECSSVEDSNPVYRLVEVTDNIFPKPNDKTFTCLTVRPRNDTEIPFYYIKTLNKCLDIRGQKFERKFWNTTEKDDDLVRELYEFRLEQSLSY